LAVVMGKALRHPPEADTKARSEEQAFGPLYPFDSHYFDLAGVRLHYLDEGPRDARPIVMLHGNPTWSFYYRNLVLALRDEYRCIVPDHVGMGLSDKPDDTQYDYTLARRVDDLDKLLAHLQVTEDVTLVLHDWGGMIGMAWAARKPAAIRSLVVLNTAAFPLPKGKTLPRSLRFCRNTSLGALLVRGFNGFARAAASRCAVARRLSPSVRKAYLAPYNSWANRIAVLRFVQDIPLDVADRAYEQVCLAERSLEQFRSLPMLICWGAKDFVFDDDFLAEWARRFPDAEVHRFADAGHYVLEDAADEIVPLVSGFLKADRTCD